MATSSTHNHTHADNSNVPDFFTASIKYLQSRIGTSFHLSTNKETNKDLKEKQTKHKKDEFQDNNPKEKRKTLQERLKTFRGRKSSSGDKVAQSSATRSASIKRKSYENGTCSEKHNTTTNLEIKHKENHFKKGFRKLKDKSKCKEICKTKHISSSDEEQKLQDVYTSKELAPSSNSTSNQLQCPPKHSSKPELTDSIYDQADLPKYSFSDAVGSLADDRLAEADNTDKTVEADDTDRPGEADDCSWDDDDSDDYWWSTEESDLICTKDLEKLELLSEQTDNNICDEEISQTKTDDPNEPEDINESNDGHCFPPAYDISQDALSNVAMRASTWDTIVNSLRFAMDINNFFVCDQFMGQDLASKVFSEMLSLKDHGYFHLKEHQKNTGYGRSVYVEKASSKHPHIDCLLTLIYKLAHCYKTDWKYFTVELCYCRPDEAPQEIFEFEPHSEKCALKFIYLPTKYYASSQNQPKLTLNSSAGEFDVELQLDRLVAIWGNTMEENIFTGFGDTFLVIIWLFR